MLENRCIVCGKEFEDDYFEKEQNKCILHCEKDNWGNDNKKEKLKVFFSYINNDIIEKNESFLKNINLNNEMENEYDFEVNKYEYNNVIFPRFGEYFIAFNSIPFDNLNNKINISFNQCIFSSDVSFDLIHKAKNISFNQCIFKGEVIFDNLHFHNNFIFEECEISSKIKFRNIVFNGIVSFIKTKFKDELLLIHSRFNDSCLFNLTEIKQLDFNNSYFRKEINFLDSKISVQNRETARIIKDSFEQQNNIIEANKFYALEMKEREKELSWRKDFFEWIVFKIHGVSSNHSQDWLLSLFWILNISFVTSIFSSMLNEKSDILQYLDKTLSMVFIIVVLGVILFNLKRYIGNLALILLSGVMYFFYYKFFGTLSLDCIANKINPFSVMNSWDNLTFGEFIYKIIIAYLIYQLIISIRQNTRRK